MGSEAFRDEIAPVAESIRRHTNQGYGVALMVFLKPNGEEVEMDYITPMEPEHVGAICKRILDSLGLGYDVPRLITTPKMLAGVRL